MDEGVGEKRAGVLSLAQTRGADKGEELVSEGLGVVGKFP